MYDPTTDKYLGLRWRENNWETFVTGGIEEGQTPEEAARAEVQEETDYMNLRLIKSLPNYQAKFFHGPKNVNRHAFFSNFLFELTSNEKSELSEAEQNRYESVWLSKEELKDFSLPEGHRFIFNSIEG